MPIIKRNDGQTFAPKPLPKSPLEGKLPGVMRAMGRLALGGQHPSEVSTETLLALVRTADNPIPVEERYKQRIKSPLTAIRGWCVVECRCGSVKAVNTCEITNCPLWPFRMGNNPLLGKFKEGHDASEPQVE